jgi:hypothetical protein
VAVESQESIFLFEYEDGTRYYTWRLAHVALESDPGEITIRAARGPAFAVSVPVHAITRYETVVRKDISLFGYLLGAMLGDWTGLLIVLLAPVALIDAILARRTAFPVIKLSHASKQGEVAIFLRSRHRRKRGRIETLELAQHLVAFLRQNGYRGLMPDLEHG